MHRRLTVMAQTYLLFDFGADEAKVQQARHKLDGWRQAFRLDKKLQFKFDRGENAAGEAAPAETPAKLEKGKAEKSKAKPKRSGEDAPEKNGNVKLIVRLYFSGHEKLSEQRWMKQIPSEEPFKGASPRVVPEGAPEFAETLQRFDSLD